MRRILEDLLKLVSLAVAFVVLAAIHVVIDAGSARGMIDWTGAIVAVMFVIFGVEMLLDLLDWLTE
jgi:hypothetical protein